MDKSVYTTLVKYDHKLYGRNAYVRGRIAGYLDCICGITSSWSEVKGVGRTIKTKCTLKEYEMFIDKVEKHYPGLCEFYY